MKIRPNIRNMRSLVACLAVVIAFLCIGMTAPSSVVAVTGGNWNWYIGGTNGGPQPGYLDIKDAGGNHIHVLNDAITSDLDIATTPGEYCNAFHTNDQIRFQNGNDIHATTGYDPGSSLLDWQEGDGSNNVCQARGNTWGFQLNGTANNFCQGDFVPCGIEQFVRLGNGENNRPWSDSFGTSPAPALTIGMNVKLQTLNVTAGAYGFYCPVLKDVINHNYIEYCLMNWQTGGGFPAISQYDTLANINPANNISYSCQSTKPAGTNVDIIFTTFQTGLNWATERSGSSDIFGTPSNKYQIASITAQNLRNVIARLQLSTPTGCQRPLSNDVRDYALVGFEAGAEGGNLHTIGESVSNESLVTSTDALYPGDTLSSGQTMYSSDYVDHSRGYKVVMQQSDGNLVSYDSFGNYKWQSHTSGTAGAHLKMEGDGNLVIYNANNQGVWQTHTSSPGSYATIQGGDGNFVVYKGTQPQWDSNSHP